jgi:hypothetical protein
MGNASQLAGKSRPGTRPFRSTFDAVPNVPRYETAAEGGRVTVVDRTDDVAVIRSSSSMQGQQM